MKKKICSLVLVMTLIFTSLAFTSLQKADAAGDINFTLSFIKNGSHGVMRVQTVTYGTYTTINKCAYTKEGYTFAGWYAFRVYEHTFYYTNGKEYGWYTPDAISKKADASSWHKALIRDGARADTLTSVNGERISLTAQWTPTYTIRFEGGAYGNGYMNDLTMVYGSGKSVPECSLSRSYHQFIGWTAFRESDEKMYYTDGSSEEWYDVGKQPAGWSLRIGPDQWKCDMITSVPGDEVILYAVWFNCRTGSISYGFQYP
ncbi:MAG: InlB B-repeat-containing protein [Acutalibacteraceae bacterium]